MKVFDIFVRLMLMDNTNECFYIPKKIILDY